VSDAAIVAFGAVSALGEGSDAVSAGEPGQCASVAIDRDEELTRAGLDRPFVARARVPPTASDRATWLLGRSLELCLADLERVRPAFRTERLGLVVGTSSGGMRTAEVAFAQAASGKPCSHPEAATYWGPVAEVARQSGLRFDPVLVVLGACASSLLAMGLASRCLARGQCDLVLAGGFDDVTVFVAAGFEALRATTASPPPRPFRRERDGMALGEGAGMVAMVRARDIAALEARAIAYVKGFGAASDAVHLTAPDREGRALEQAVKSALDEAGRPPIDLVSPHATATPFNDPVEARVLRAAPGTSEAVVAPFKAQIGHTLGAAGVLEALMAVDAMTRGVLPAAVGRGEIDPDARVRLLERAERAEPGFPRNALKLACAFGGSNAALVLGRSPAPPRAMREAFVSAAVRVGVVPGAAQLAAEIAAPAFTEERLGRSDALARLALAAIAALRAAGVHVTGAGIVVGTALATLETNAAFAARIRERGARMAEPRRFPYTSPNAAAGECSIAFGLTGPGFSVGGGMHAGLEALAAAALLVEGGDADRVVVVAVDDVGPASCALGDADPALRLPSGGAVATLVSAERTGALARVGHMTLTRGPRLGVSALTAPGHMALAPLVSPGQGPDLTLESGSPPDAFARIDLQRV
jgi:3-oxoacyl-[acyl-carrier-protein] synthase-1/3-oxoacyl-[acyl-carrier-protein] synthase II